jgi:hypothetical protein
MRRWLAEPATFGQLLVVVFACGLALAGAVWWGINVAIDAHDAKTAATRQQEGRAIAIDVLCGGNNGVAVAGRKVLAGELPGQQGPGLPEETQRAYVNEIASSVLQVAGIRTQGVLQPDGRINCQRLRIAARATHKP